MTDRMPVGRGHPPHPGSATGLSAPRRRAVAALLRADLRGLTRDPLLGPLLLMGPLLIVMVRLLVPPAQGWTAARFGIDLAAYYPFILGALFVLDVPMNVGALLGMTVLEERDERTLAALQVTPLGLSGYTAYRLGLAATIGLIYLVVGLPAAGLAPAGRLLAALPAALPGALVAPVAGLAVVSIARNKVEGLAVFKIGTLVLAAPLVAWFVAAPWTLLLGVVPTYWPLQALWRALDGQPAWPFALVGTVYSAVILVYLLHRFRAQHAG